MLLMLNDRRMNLSVKSMATTETLTQVKVLFSDNKKTEWKVVHHRKNLAETFSCVLPSGSTKAA